MPNIATWWCGQPAERERRARVRSTSVAIAPAFQYGADRAARRAASVVGGELDAKARAKLSEAIRARGVDYVGQDIVRLRRRRG